MGVFFYKIHVKLSNLQIKSKQIQQPGDNLTEDQKKSNYCTRMTPKHANKTVTMNAKKNAH